ncbi:hypothetical protein ACN26Y_23135 [Micromonospora sp. WMMD558]|uniref:hypothetical protein n=1 Tax=unclassified Micromonospora TaxID=2617518 RepID=UPI0012B48FB1|nr:hypothetical protein [Micromonospora sp. WMMC415]QGN48902.1 hypothetical protein GKC29_20145 [Micromonospora sp. WMMC415]
MTFEADRHTREIPLDRPHPAGDPTLEIVEWSAGFGTELVLCDGEGIPLAAHPARIPVPDVSFTAFVSWAGFDPVDVDRADPGHEPYLPVLSQVRSALTDHFANRAPRRTAEGVEGRKGDALVLVG